MTDRKRDPLPEGYQFGDARPLCNHDYRARWKEHLGFYQAVCETCGHTAGVVEVRDLTVLHGVGFWSGSNVQAAGAGQTGRTIITSGWSPERYEYDSEEERGRW